MAACNDSKHGVCDPFHASNAQNAPQNRSSGRTTCAIAAMMVLNLTQRMFIGGLYKSEIVKSALKALALTTADAKAKAPTRNKEQSTPVHCDTLTTDIDRSRVDKHVVEHAYHH